MKFRTEIEVNKSHFFLDHKQNIVMLGSCFTENIGTRLKSNKFHVNVNPFGVLYNPFSVNKHLNHLLSGNNPKASEIKQQGDLYLHFDYHSAFSHTDARQALKKMQDAFNTVDPAQTDVLFLTWGTSRIYRLKESGELVANCHKFPAENFIREDKNEEEIYRSCAELFPKLKAKNPELQIVLSISPVRHLKDGFIENQRNKARLLLAAEKLESSFDYVSYFPSYEILMDDLRDYRFYAGDLVHPSDEAVEYISEKFSEHYFSKETLKIIQDIRPVVQGMKHRIFSPESQETRHFAKANLEKARKLTESYPELDLSAEMAYFRDLLNINLTD